MTNLEYSCTGDDERVFQNNAARARACPEIYRFGVSREHYVWLADQIDAGRALIEAARGLVEECNGGERSPSLGALAKLESATSIAWHASQREPAPRLTPASDVDPTAGLDPNFNWGGDR